MRVPGSQVYNSQDGSSHSGEDTVLVVDGDIAEVLDEMRGPAGRGQAGGELLDADGVVGSPGSPAPGRQRRRCRSGPSRPGRTGDRPGGRAARSSPGWPRSHTTGRPRRQERGGRFRREPQHAMIPVLAPGQDHPFGEERRLQVRGQHRAAVEQALGQPVLTGPIAGGLPKAEICDMLTSDLTPASAAACAKITVASRRPDPARREPTPVIHLATWSLTSRAPGVICSWPAAYPVGLPHGRSQRLRGTEPAARQRPHGA